MQYAGAGDLMTEPMTNDRVDSVDVIDLTVDEGQAGFYTSCAPFNLIFVGPVWSEADLLALACTYEAATHHRRAPALRVG